MKVENGKIIKATESELLDKWLDEDWCELMSFPEYLLNVKNNGTTVIPRSEERKGG